MSTKAQANPDDQKLAGQVQTLFRGETLRGLLLNAYAFDTMAKVALIAAWVSLIGGIVLLGCRCSAWCTPAGRPPTSRSRRPTRSHAGRLSTGTTGPRGPFPLRKGPRGRLTTALRGPFPLREGPPVG